jgi:hypothetical protein
MIVLGVGLYGTWLRWTSTRIWRPLDIPISLSPGRLHTSEFVINAPATYIVGFMARDGFGHERADQYEYCLPALGTSWSLSSNGQLIAAGKETPCGDWLGGFHAGSGLYVLDVNISRDGSGFNSRMPRLVILEDGGFQASVDAWSTLLFVACLLLVTMGAGILAFSVISICNRSQEENYGLPDLLQ